MENTFKGSKNYVASPELMNAVNIAVALKKPLLIKGEPGTGKTMLAEAVAEALGKKLIIWSVKSTTKAQDGLYVYDVVQRLYDSQFGSAGVDDIAKYIKLGKLGEAFSADEQVVLLIDEVDKADLEFPNDLLWELDKMEFYIPETKETIKAKHRPIVIITSNAEKELPDAFLRRCIFHYIEFPDQQQMEKIIRVHFDHVDETLLMQAMQAFYYIRSIDSVEKKTLDIRAYRLDPRARAYRRGHVPHHEGDPVHRGAPQKGQGYLHRAAPTEKIRTPCLLDFSTFCARTAFASA